MTPVYLAAVSNLLQLVSWIWTGEGVSSVNSSEIAIASVTTEPTITFPRANLAIVTNVSTYLVEGPGLIKLCESFTTVRGELNARVKFVDTIPPTTAKDKIPRRREISSSVLFCLGKYPGVTQRPREIDVSNSRAQCGQDSLVLAKCCRFRRHCRPSFNGIELTTSVSRPTWVSMIELLNGSEYLRDTFCESNVAYGKLP